MILKQVTHYPDTNSVEATWVEVITPAIEVPESTAPDTTDKDGNIIPGEVIPAHTVPAVERQVRCHSYADVQMDMLQADLGSDAVDYADLIATVTAGIKPYIAPPPVIPTSLTMKQARLALLGAGYLDAVEAGVSAMPRASQIIWEFASTVERSDQLTATLAAALNLDDAELDALFSAGAVL